MNEPAVKYPLPCGCAGPKFLSLCQKHQLDALQRDARMLGMVPHCSTCKCSAPNGPASRETT